MMATLLLTTLSLKGIPGPLSWRNPPVTSHIENGETLSIIAGKLTDWFIDPFDGRTVANSPTLLFQPAADFVLSARVEVDFRSKWDAAALVVHVNETTWAKLALELSADNRPTFVTVVTRGLSDDCNSFSIEGRGAWLQVARSGQALIFYGSEDGRAWKLLRTFSLGPAPELRAGFSVQSPTGEGARATFTQIRYETRRVANVYTGK